MCSSVQSNQYSGNGMSESTRTTFSSLPREVRDCIYNAALVNIDTSITSCPPTDPRYHEKRPVLVRFCLQDTSTYMYPEASPFLALVQKWASRSRTAREACAAFYANNIFKLSWSVSPTLLVGQGASHLALGTRLLEGNLGTYLRTVVIDIDSPRSLLSGGDYDTSHCMSGLLKCPSLRKADMSIGIPLSATNALDEAIPALASITPICKGLIQKIGASSASTWRPWYTSYLPRMACPGPGLKVCLCHSYRNQGAWHQYWYDVTWMWKVPSEEIRRLVQNGNSSKKDKLKVSIADGGRPGEEQLLLESLREGAEGLVHEGEDVKYLYEHRGPRT